MTITAPVRASISCLPRSVLNETQLNVGTMEQITMQEFDPMVNDVVSVPHAATNAAHSLVLLCCRLGRLNISV